jgi:2-hydroxycyclohexanecarboxyl-CoA dehydrogenase
MVILDGKSVVVTGGASGIGEAITRALASQGFTVGVFDLNQEGASILAEEISKLGQGKVFAYAVDITDHDAVAAVVDQFEVDAGPIYGLVNNAGWDEAKPFVETNLALWKKVIDINLYGPLNVTHAVLKCMAKAGRGRVISISSDAGRVGSSGEAVYSACKGGVVSLMKTLARENSRNGITFNSVCPGPTNTPLLAEITGAGGEKLIKGMKRAIPMGRLAEPEDYPGIITFLLSDGASYITGQTVSVSGGLSMHG